MAAKLWCCTYRIKTLTTYAVHTWQAPILKAAVFGFEARPISLVSFLSNWQGFNPKIHFSFSPTSNCTDIYQITQEGLLITKTNQLKPKQRHILEVSPTKTWISAKISALLFFLSSVVLMCFFLHIIFIHKCIFQILALPLIKSTAIKWYKKVLILQVMAVDQESGDATFTTVVVDVLSEGQLSKDKILHSLPIT